MKYLIVSDNSVSNETQIAAHHALASARKELKLPMVKIKWFVNARYSDDFRLKEYMFFENDPGVQGLFYGAEPDTIYIQAHQTDDNIKNSVYHETFHLWQCRNSHHFTEENAYGYASDIEKRLSAFGEDDSVYLEHMIGKDWSVTTEKKEEKQKSERKCQSVQVAKSTGLSGYTKKQTHGYIIAKEG